jgi:hypothetical protein
MIPADLEATQEIARVSFELPELEATQEITMPGVVGVFRRHTWGDGETVLTSLEVTK